MERLTVMEERRGEISGRRVNDRETGKVQLTYWPYIGRSYQVIVQVQKYQKIVPRRHYVWHPSSVRIIVSSALGIQVPIYFAVAIAWNSILGP